MYRFQLERDKINFAVGSLPTPVRKATSSGYSRPRFRTGSTDM